MRWERVQQMGLGDSSSGPGKRWGHTCNAIKGGRFLYVFGGFVKKKCLTNQVHVFDAETQIWTQPVINGVPPCPRDSHSCTTVNDNLFVFGGTDGTNYLKDLHVLDTSSHTWFRPNTRGVGPAEREAHSATLVDKRLFIFGGCRKPSHSDDEVYYNDLYILNTETFEWQRAVTTGKPPSARNSHTCSTWNNKIIIVGGEDLDDNFLCDVHVLDTDTFMWNKMLTFEQLLTPRAGHVTVAFENNLLVFGGYTDFQDLCGDLYVLNLETCVWYNVVTMEGPSARFSSAAVSLDPYKAGLCFFVGGCNKNLEPMDDLYYLHTGIEIPLKTGLTDHEKPIFHAKITKSDRRGHTIETNIDGQLFQGVVYPIRHNSFQMRNPSFSFRKRHAMLDGDFDRPAKKPRTSRKGSGSCSQQAVFVNPSDDVNKKGADSNDMNAMIGTLDAHVNMMRPHETDTTVVKDQEASSSQQVNPIYPSDDANKTCADLNEMDVPMIDTVTDMVKPQETETTVVKDQEASSSQQVNPIDPSDDANKKCADSNDMDTPVVDTLTDIVRPQEIETTPAKDQEASSSQQVNPVDPSDDTNKKSADSNDMDTPMFDTLATNVNMGAVSIEPSPVTLARENAEPLRNETSTDTAKVGTEGDSSPQNQEDEGTLAAEDAKAEKT